MAVIYIYIVYNLFNIGHLKCATEITLTGLDIQDTSSQAFCGLGVSVKIDRIMNPEKYHQIVIHHAITSGQHSKHTADAVKTFLYRKHRMSTSSPGNYSRRLLKEIYLRRFRL